MAETSSNRSHLMSLPIEVRELIYAAVTQLDFAQPEHPDKNDWLTFGLHKKAHLRKPVTPTTTALMLSHRQIFSEMQAFLKRRG